MIFVTKKDISDEFYVLASNSLLNTIFVVNQEIGEDSLITH